MRNLYRRSFERELDGVNIGTIKGIPLVTVTGEGDSIDSGETHARRVIMAMTVWTIWKLRCKARIEEIHVDDPNYVKLWREEMERTIRNEYYAAQALKGKRKEKAMNLFKSAWLQNDVFAILDEEGIHIPENR